MCRSRRELSNAYLLAKIGVDTTENEPLEVWGKIQFNIHSPLYWRVDTARARSRTGLDGLRIVFKNLEVAGRLPLGEKERNRAETQWKSEEAASMLTLAIEHSIFSKVTNQENLRDFAPLETQLFRKKIKQTLNQTSCAFPNALKLAESQFPNVSKR